MIYGYCRISTEKQNLERQIKNIKEKYENAVIIKEVYTGKKSNRPEFNKLIKKVREGDLIVFDEVSRMSRNAEEGFEIYKELFNKNIELEFLKEAHINTSSYKKAMEQGFFYTDLKSGDKATDELFNGIMKAVEKFMMSKIESDIFYAFERAENEIKHLSQRTKEGMAVARLNGKRIGGIKGSKLTTKKSIEMKEKIKKYNVNFGGTLNNADCIRLLKITPNTFYKYKKELMEEI